MISAFHGIELGKRSLIAHSQALFTTGHNVSNADMEGYTRQQITLETTDPLFVPGYTRAETPGQIGQGSQVEKIKRIRDELLDNRIIFENKDLGFWETRNKYLYQVEMVFNEPSDKSLREIFNQYIVAWEDLANNPDEPAARKEVIERTNSLTYTIRHQYDQLKQIRDNVETEIKIKVSQINSLAKQIADLNERILKSETMGDFPNDLYDKRDLLIDEVSKMVDLQISREDNDEFILYIGGMMLVQGAKTTDLQLAGDALNEGYSNVVWETEAGRVKITSGELASLIYLRDVDLLSEIKRLDSFAVNLIDLTNELHRDVFGTNEITGQNFFTAFPFTRSVVGNFDQNNDGADDSTYLFRVSGQNVLDEKDKLGIQGIMNLNGTDIQYFATDTVKDVIDRINFANTGITAFLNNKGVLTLKADISDNIQNPDFVLRHMEDDGFFLTGYAGLLADSGPAGAFDWQNVNDLNKFINPQEYTVAPLTHPSAWISMEDNIQNDIAYIAAASGIDTTGDGLKDQSFGQGDSSNALRIAALKHKPVMVGMSQTFREYYENVIADIGLRSEAAEKNFQNQELIVHNLVNERKSISGVNIDEELANMVKFQHGYAASARFVTEFDKMLDVIINRMGV